MAHRRLGERSADGDWSLAETVCLGFCHSCPAVRVGDVIDAGSGVVERVLGVSERCAGEPAAVSVLERPVLLGGTAAYAGLARAVSRMTPGLCSRR